MKTLLLTLLLCPVLLAAAEPVVQVGLFSSGDLSDWQEKSFEGMTDYRLVNKDNRTVLRARSEGAASGRFKEVKIDLDKTPVLHWSWRVDNLLEGVDERSKAGDDYPARVYVVFSGGLFFWRTRAINYVWSSNQPEGAVWPNAFTANARMLAVQSGPERLGRWVSEQRNVAEDYRRLFGEEPGNVDAVAIMTDTDNSGQSATAWYGDIRFSAESP
ncbi:MAG: DUF3047 domain-containing protein [Pseudomonadota bacterium]